MESDSPDSECNLPEENYWCSPRTVLTHRLNLMRNATVNRDDPQTLVNSLYATVNKIQDRVTRPHQSKKGTHPTLQVCDLTDLE